MTIAESNAPIPENVSRIIQRKGLFKRCVAKSAGLTAQQFTDMLNGRKIIKPCDLLAIADAIGVSINDLFADGRDTA